MTRRYVSRESRHDAPEAPRVNYRLVEHPELAPGCCLLTRTDEGPFIDTGIDVEDLDPIGRIYIATSTVSDLAQGLGYAPPVAAQRARDRIDELEHELVEAAQTIGGLLAANAALTEASLSLGVPQEPSHIPPAGSEQEVLLWVAAPGDDIDQVLARAQSAHDAELLEPRPRQGLLTELSAYLSLKEPAQS